jgi:hypothetical protein
MFGHEAGLAFDATDGTKSNRSKFEPIKVRTNRMEDLVEPPGGTLGVTAG